MTRIARSAMILLIAFIALFADKDLRISQEIVLGSLFNIGIWLILRRFWARLRDVTLDIDTIVLLLFAVGSTVQALGTHVETEIPRLRMILRAVYYGYLFFCLSPLRKRFTFAEHALIALFLFTSLPFHWAAIMGSARNLLPAATLLYVLLRIATVPGGRKGSFNTFLIPAGLAVILIYGAAQAANGNWFDGVDGMARLFTGLACFLIVRAGALDQRRLPGAYVVFLLVNIAFLVIAAGYAAHEQPDFFTDKRLALGGINTNDIGGYFAGAAPIAVAALFAADSRRARVIAIVSIAGAAAMILLSQARLAWPTVVICVAWLVIRMRIRTGFSARTSVSLAAGIIIAAIAITLGVVFYLPSEELKRFDLTTLDYRFSLIKQAALILSEHPLQGTGVGNLAAIGAFTPAQDNEGLLRFVQIAGGFVHAHNLVAQVWLEGGLVYLLCILAAFTAGFTLLFTKQEEGGAIAPVVLLTIFLQGLLNYHFDVYHVWLLFWTAAALVAPVWPESEKKRPWPALALAIMFCLFAYHSVVVTVHSQAMQSIKGYRFRHFLGTVELKDLPGAAPHAPPKLVMFERAASLYPFDRRLSQEAGEAYFYTGGKVNLGRAASLYESCARREVNPAFCYMRLATIGALAGEPLSLVEEYKSKSRARDPMNLVSRTAVNPF